MTNKHFNASFDEKLLKKSDQTGVLVNSIQDMQKSLGNSIHSLQDSLNFIDNEIDNDNLIKSGREFLLNLNTIVVEEEEEEEWL